MIRVEIHDDWNDPHGGGIDHRVVIETDAGYNPDVVQDMVRRAVDCWHTQRLIRDQED